MLKRTILTLSTAALMSLSMAQSDGRSFDAAVELVPGMTVERSGVIYGGDYSKGLLQNGDIVRTDAQAGNYTIVTSDGSVITLSSNTELTIAGGLKGYDVFQVNQGSAVLSGNAYNGVTVSPYLRSLLQNRTSADNVGTPIISGDYEPVGGPYARAYYGPAVGVYGPVNPYVNNVVLQPWSSTYWQTTPFPMQSWWTRWNGWTSY